MTVVALMCYGNLRGIREAGHTFAIPTYLFVGATGSLIIIGLIRAALGQLHAHAIPLHAGVVPLGTPGKGLLYGAGIIIVLRAFANGGSSLTGLEAISNGVSTFRPPEGRNARRVLVIMALILGSLVSGVSLLAHITHAVPYLNGTPTVLSQEAKYVFGSTGLGKFGFYFVQGATMLILWTGGNTSFNGFPNLASFVAEDSFLPRQLTRRGHRLVFSNGIILLTVAAEALLIVTNAQLDVLVGVYAVGVFTGFTFAGFGMSKHHLRLREPGWRHKLAINGFAGLLSLSVVLIFVIVKFKEGVWIVVVLFIVLVPTLIRLHKQYEEEQKELEENVSNAAVAPILRRHVVLVFVDRLDLATARALQYAADAQPGRAPGGAFCPGQRATRPSSRTSGVSSGSPAFLSTSSNVRTGVSRGPRWSSSPKWRPTGRPKSVSCCPTASSKGSGNGYCTTTRRTTSPLSSTSCRT